MTPNEAARADIMRLFTGHQVQLRAYAYAICRDTHLTEDIVQDVAVVLVTKYSDYDKSRPFLPWAIGITRRKALEMVRKHGKLMPVPEEAVLDRLQDSLVEAGDTEILEARLDAMMACVENIGPEGRSILSMKYMRRMSARDIATTTRRKVTAINSLLQRLRAKLIQCVDRRMAEATS